MLVLPVWSTPDGDKLIAYMARVSNPENQANENIEKLIAYCMRKNHWSIFEMCNMCLEIETSRAISAQIIRHRSFSFQEFSQRYAAVNPEAYEPVKARRQDKKNRQNSLDDMSKEDIEWFYNVQHDNWAGAHSLYDEALKRGIAKENARMLLPLGTQTRLYMNGTVRSWITYIMLRTDPSTQKEHRDIAVRAKELLTEAYPVVAQALDLVENEKVHSPASNKSS